MQESRAMSENNIYQPVETADGSPSLEWAASGEAMHNRQGAFSETLVIYGQAIKDSIELTGSTSVLSVGLGLAYNEVLAATLHLKHKSESFKLLSFEANQDLRDQWLNWAFEKMETELANTYNKILMLCSEEYSVDSREVKKFLKSAYINQQAQLREQLGTQTQFSDKYSCVLYDLFSSHTAPEYWSEEFLFSFFDKTCADQCIVSTYAAKGNLTRSLNKLGFNVEKPEGFGGKRNRTYATRK